MDWGKGDHVSVPKRIKSLLSLRKGVPSEMITKLIGVDQAGCSSAGHKEGMNKRGTKSQREVPQNAFFCGQHTEKNEAGRGGSLGENLSS